jgi:hypothetical protein
VAQTVSRLHAMLTEPVEQKIGYGVGTFVEHPGPTIDE